MAEEITREGILRGAKESVKNTAKEIGERAVGRKPAPEPQRVERQTARPSGQRPMTRGRKPSR